MEKKELRAIASGKVQMVMFRDFVRRHARRFALVGYVRNIQNGRVEVVAQGYEDSLQKFLEHLNRGPFLARVSNVDVEWRNPTQEFDAFDIVI